MKKDKMLVNRVAVLIIAMFVINFNTASAMRPPKIIDNVVSYFQNMAFSSHNTSVQAKEDYKDPIILIDKFLGVARIITGVSVQIGLSDGSIPVDQLIEELLNLGSIRLASLEKFNKKSADQFLEKLRNAKKNLKKDTVSTEEAFITLNNVRESWRINSKELKKLPKDLKDLDVVKQWNISKFKEFEIDNTVNSLNGIIEKEQVDYKALVASLRVLNDAIEKSPKGSSFESAHTSIRSISPLIEFAEAMKLLDSSPFSFLKSFDVEKKNFATNLRELKDLLSGFTPSLGIMKAILDAKFSKPRRNYTSGFVNGVDDLEQIIADVQNDNILQLKLQFSLLDSLSPLRELAEPILEYQKKMSPVLTIDHHKTVRKIAKLKSEFDTSSMDISLVSAVADNFSKCSALTVYQAITTKVSEIGKSAELLIRKVDSLKVVSNVFNKNVRKKFEELSEKTKVEDIKSILNLFEKVKVHLKDLQGVIDWKTNVETMKTNEVYITKFHTDQYIKGYIDHLNCILNSVASVEKAAQSSQLMANVRILNKDNVFSKSFEEISSALAASANSIKPIKEIGEKIEKDETNDVIELMKLDGVKNYTKSIGDVAMILTTVKAALNKTDLFESFVKTGKEVQNLVESSKDKEFIIAAQKYWSDFETVSSQISKFLTETKEWKSRIRIPEDLNNMTSLGFRISKLNETHDVNLQTEARLIAIEKIATFSNDINLLSALDDFRKDLGRLSKFELSFSNYKSSLNSMPNVLTQIHEIFEVPKPYFEPLSENITRNIIFTLLAIFLVALIGLTIWCAVDYSCWFWTLKNKFFSGKQVMKTAREGGAKPGGKKVPKKDSSIGSDGREKRKKASSSHSEALPPPPPPPPPVSQPPGSNVGSSGSSGPTDSTAASPPLPPPPPSVGAASSGVSPSTPKQATENATSKVTSKASVSKPSASKASVSKPSPSKTSVSKATASKTSGSKASASTVKTETVSKEKTKTTNKTRTVEATNTKTSADEAKTKEAEQEPKPENKVSDMKVSDKKSSDKKNKKKRQDDTLAQPDSTDVTHKTIETEKYTKDGGNTLNECPSDIYNNEKHPISDGTSSPAPPLPHKKESKKPCLKIVALFVQWKPMVSKWLPKW